MVRLFCLAGCVGLVGLPGRCGQSGAEYSGNHWYIHEYQPKGRYSAGIFVLSVLVHTLYAVVFSTPFMVTAYGCARRTIQATLGSSSPVLA